MNKDEIIKTVNAVNFLKGQLEKFLSDKTNIDQITSLKVEVDGLAVVTEYQYDRYDPPSEKSFLITWETLEKLQQKPIPTKTTYHDIF